MSRPLRWYDYITINIYFMGLTTLSQTMTPLVVPLLVQQFVGETQQGTFYGTVRLWSLMVALLVQSLMGMVSDHSNWRWGKRRPFIFIGTIADLVIMAAIGFTAGLEGFTGYWVLFTLLLLLSVASNTAHGPAQGLIPDLVPENQRGKHSGVKAFFEVPLPVILVSFTIGRMIGSGNMWAGILTAMAIVAFTMAVTMFAPEKPPQGKTTPLNFTPFLRLLLMTALFTIIILGLGYIVRMISRGFISTSQVTILLVMGVLGFIAMAIAVCAGVYLSVQISIGKAAKDNPSFTWWVVNRLAFLIGSTNLASFAVYYLQGRLGIERELAAKPASQLIMFVGIFILLLAIPSGWLTDRFGSKIMVATSGIIATLGTLVLILAPNLTFIYIGGIIVGIAIGLFYTANWALGTSLVPKEQAGRYLGISNLAGAGAGAVGAYIGGPIADYFTVNVASIPGLGYVLLFAIYGLLFLTSVLTLMLVKQPVVND